MNSSTNPDFNIFNALHEAIIAKDQNQLKFAKCQNCGRFTPYRLRFMKDDGLCCKNCGTAIAFHG